MKQPYLIILWKFCLDVEKISILTMDNLYRARHSKRPMYYISTGDCYISQINDSWPRWVEEVLGEMEYNEHH